MRSRTEFDDLKLVIKQIRANPPFDRETELAVARRARLGDRRAREQLAAHNLGLVVAIAARFRGRGFRLEDLVQEGSCGLVKAIEHFEPDRGNRFSTYALWWIRAYITRALRRGAGTVTRSTAPASPSPRDVSLDDPVSPGADTTHLDQLADDAPHPEDQVGRTEMQGLVRDRLARVRKRMGGLAWDILMDRLTKDDQRTLQEIGDEWGLSRERVRQIEASTRKFLGGYLSSIRDAA